MSTNTGLAPASKIELVDAKKLKGVVMTSSPPPIPKALSATTKASVPEAHVRACFTPIAVANSFSSPSNLVAHDERLLLKSFADRFKDLRFETFVLPCEIEKRK